MYSSDERRGVRAIPWALDELESPERFLSLSGDTRFDRRPAEVHGAHVDDTSVSDDAYSRGVADGEQAMRAAYDASVSAALAALADAVERVHVHEAPWIANAEENLAAMAVVVARHVIEREVTTDGQIVGELVRRALGQFPLDQTVSVRLHPDDIATCEPLLSPDVLGRVRDLRLLIDPNVQRGGCLVEGRERVIDGRVDTSLERAYRMLGQIQA